MPQIVVIKPSSPTNHAFEHLQPKGWALRASEETKAVRPFCAAASSHMHKVAEAVQSGVHRVRFGVRGLWTSNSWPSTATHLNVGRRGEHSI